MRARAGGGGPFSPVPGAQGRLLQRWGAWHLLWAGLLLVACVTLLVGPHDAVDRGQRSWGEERGDWKRREGVGKQRSAVSGSAVFASEGRASSSHSSRGGEGPSRLAAVRTALLAGGASSRSAAVAEGEHGAGGGRRMAGAAARAAVEGRSGQGARHGGSAARRYASSLGSPCLKGVGCSEAGDEEKQQQQQQQQQGWAGGTAASTLEAGGRSQGGSSWAAGAVYREWAEKAPWLADVEDAAFEGLLRSVAVEREEPERFFELSEEQVVELALRVVQEHAEQQQQGKGRGAGEASPTDGSEALKETEDGSSTGEGGRGPRSSNSSMENALAAGESAFRRSPLLAQTRAEQQALQRMQQLLQRHGVREAADGTVQGEGELGDLNRALQEDTGIFPLLARAFSRQMEARRRRHSSKQLLDPASFIAMLGQRNREARERLVRETDAREASGLPLLEEWQQLGREWPPQPTAPLRLRQRQHEPHLNADKFPDWRPEDGKVWVLAVHKRVKYLRVMLQSMAAVEGIGEVLLVVSHDGFFPEVDRLIRSISFCRVRQLYLPWSAHFNETTYPAVSPEDCAPFVPKFAFRGGDEGEAGNATAAGKPCFGRPDSFGHMRNPRYTSVKLHWWWMANTVWDRLPETRGFNGHMVFLEDDFLLLPTAVRQVESLARAKQALCPACSFAGLGYRHREHDWESEPHLIIDRRSNEGIVFNRTVWESIKSQSRTYCLFDDYNFDNSLDFSLVRYWEAPFALKWSRPAIVHFGTCGVNYGLDRKSNVICEVPESLAKDLLAKPFNFSLNSTAVEFVAPMFEEHEAVGWGGWSDPRDNALCYLMANDEGLLKTL